MKLWILAGVILQENSKVFSMDKLREFGRKALFYVRVLSGYEERRIRSLRFDTERRIKEVQLPSVLFFNTGFWNVLVDFAL